MPATVMFGELIKVPITLNSSITQSSWLFPSFDNVIRILKFETEGKSVIEIGLEEERFRKDEETEKINDLQKEYNVISKELAAAEERLVYLCKTQSEKEKLRLRSL